MQISRISTQSLRILSNNNGDLSVNGNDIYVRILEHISDTYGLVFFPVRSGRCNWLSLFDPVYQDQ